MPERKFCQRPFCSLHRPSLPEVGFPIFPSFFYPADLTNLATFSVLRVKPTPSMKGQYDPDHAQSPHLVEERISATGLTMAQIQLLQGPRPQHLTRHPASAGSPTMARMIPYSKTSSSRPSGAILRHPPNSGAYSITSNSHRLVDVKKSQLRMMRYCGHMMLSMQTPSWTSSRGRRV
jgi:hypothetical protein